MPVRLVGTDLSGIDIAKVAVTANVSISATTSATGTVVATVGPFSVINEGAYYVDVYTPSLVKGTTNVDLELWEGTPGTGTLLTTLSGHLIANAVPFFSHIQVALGAGSHTLKVAGFVDAGTGTFSANVGTTGNFPNATVRVYPA
jgi:hypothetical protein